MSQPAHDWSSRDSRAAQFKLAGGLTGIASSSGAADSLARSQVEAEGYTAFISPIDQADGRIYRVRLGPFEERARAERAAKGIKKKLKLEPWGTAASN